MILDKKIFQKDEIDLNYLYKKFLANSKIITLLVFSTSIFSTLFISIFFNRSFLIRVPFKVYTHSPEIIKLCGSGPACKRSYSGEKVSYLLGSNWDINLERDSYLGLLATSRTSDLKYISGLSKVLLNTEEIYTNDLKRQYRKRYEYLLDIDRFEDDKRISISNFRYCSNVPDRLFTMDYIIALEDGLKTLQFRSPIVYEAFYSFDFKYSPPFISDKYINLSEYKLNKLITKKLITIFGRMIIVTSIIYTSIFLMKKEVKLSQNK